jgi:sugar-specific transcriptional regulator TrmB
VSKTTGVPQPKVYEALRKLVTRGAARQINGEPVRFAAVAPEELLDNLQTDFEERLIHARETSIDLEAPAQPAVQEAVAALSDRSAVLDMATAALAAATRRVYLSASSQELRALKSAILSAAGGGVDVVVLCFGRMAFQGDGVRVFRHASTEGILFRHHQARHLALVADSRQTIFGLAADGRKWSGIETSSEPIIAAVKGYIKHDIDMQQLFRDFGTELVEAYGPGLQGLESYRADAPAAGARSWAALTESRVDQARSG